MMGKEPPAEEGGSLEGEGAGAAAAGVRAFRPASFECFRRTRV